MLLLERLPRVQVTPGTYTVTYTIPASSGCPAVPVTTTVTITGVPTATIAYAGTPFCNDITAAQSVTRERMLILEELLLLQQV